MKNTNNWLPSKFIYKNKKLIASRNSKDVSIGSRLTADIIASYFDAHIKTYAKGDLLDLGCGKAPLFECYKPYVNSIICVDWGKSFHGNEYLDLTCDLNKVLPFKSNSFDTIILSDVLEHIYNPQLLWSESHRILRKNGNIIISVPFYYWIHEQPHDYYRYTEYALKKFAHQSNFNILRIESMGGIPEIITDLVSKHFSSVPKHGWRLSDWTNRFSQRILKTKMVTQISTDTKQQFPLGYFLVAEKFNA